MTTSFDQDLKRFREWVAYLLDRDNDAAMALDSSGRIVAANQAARDLLADDGSTIEGLYVDHLLEGQESLTNRLERIEKPATDRPETQIIGDVQLNDRPYSVQLDHALNADGQPLGHLLHLSPRKDQVTQLPVSADPNLAAVILEHVGSLILVADRMGRVIYASPSITNQLGYSNEEVLGDRWFDITRTSADEAEEERMNIRAGAVDSEMLDDSAYERRILDRNGDPHWILWQDAPGPDHTVIGIGSDITDRKLFGGVSGLPTRDVFLEHLARRIKDVQGSGPRQGVGVIAVDIDRFDSIIQAFGTLEADSLLARVADRLNSRLDEGDTLAHIGGDKFAVLLEHEADRLRLSSHARLIRTCFDRPFRVGGSEIFLSASLGMVADATTSDPAEVLRQARTAATHARTTGRGRAELFRSDMAALSAASLQLEADLRRSLELNQLRLQYQPIVNLSDLSVAGFEALLRWQHPTLGLVPPDKFIPLAEETGVIIAIGRWVARQACAQLRTWIDLDPRADGLTMSVNISADQLLDNQLAEVILNALSSSNLRPEHLILEITESSLMAKAVAAAELIAELRRSGIRWSIDDFGTGYSSLSQLSTLPVDNLKVDRSFVFGMADDPGRRTIVEAVVRLGQSLALELVAEGIETEDQLAILRDLGCEKGQGYLMARPLDPDDALAFLSQT